MRKFFCLKWMLLISIISIARANTTYTDSAFKDWYYTPTGVFGRTPLSKIYYREYVKISRAKDQSVSVQKFNAAGILINTTDLKFFKGEISLITQTNQWGENFDTIWFKPNGTDEFTVTEKLKGQNPFLPCKAARYVYKNDLLQDIIFLVDSTKPGYDREGVSHYKYERYNDPARFGLIKTESFFGDIDNWVVSWEYGCHKIINEYNESGNKISTSFYGIKDEPVADRLGNFKLKIHYDKNDNAVQIDYFDVKGSPINGNFGFSHLERAYNFGFPAKETYSNLDYITIKFPGKSDSASITQYQYDKNGNETERTYYDEESRATTDNRGVFKTVYEYNSAGMLTDISFFNTHPFSVTDEFGVHSYHYERNSKGQTVSKTFFNRHGMPMKDPLEGAYQTKYAYDNWGRIISTSFWVNDSVKTQNRNGFHEILASYDANGLTTQIEYLDKESNPAKGNNDYSKQLLIYNDQSLLTERKYYDGDKPVMLAENDLFAGNYHSIKYNYDFYRRLVSIDYLDDAGKPVNANVKLQDQTRINFHRVEFNYNESRIVSEKLYDENVAPFTLDCEKGNCISPSGSGIVIAFVKKIKDSSPKKNFSGVSITDSLFFGSQLAFLNHDSILIFLNWNATKLSEVGCATFYRIAQVNKYYQLDGDVTDYFLDNDSVAARLKYKEGSLDGSCTYYYENGNIKEKGEYKKSARTGKWDYFFEDGRKQKSINFIGNENFLVECFAENGKQIVQNGNGNFEGVVLGGNFYMQVRYTVMGNVKGGLPDGEWKIYSDNSANPIMSEKYSSGKFIKGTHYYSNGKINYRDKHISSYESIHPDERVDYYGQDNFCNVTGKHVIINNGTTPFRNFFQEMHDEFSYILRGNKYKDYSGWVFLDLKYDENGKLDKKYVRLWKQNVKFESEILKMLDRFDNQPFLLVNDKKTPFEKFYLILVDSNEIAIPEELLQIARTIGQ